MCPVGGVGAEWQRQLACQSSPTALLHVCVVSSVSLLGSEHAVGTVPSPGQWL